MKGIVLYKGVSQLDNKTPILCIATLNSSNVKTGNMISTWIIREDIPPNDAVKMGLDSAVCGDCRYSSGNGCYVLPWQAPNNIFKAYHRGKYPMYQNKHKKLFKNRGLRMGAYGDPAAVPIIIWQNLLTMVDRHTGYTHQWGRLDSRWQFLMASVDNSIEANVAKDMGWRLFRVITEGTLSTSVLCPATMEESTIQCNTCSLCSGNKTKAKDIHVKVHGAKNTINKALKVLNV